MTPPDWISLTLEFDGDQKICMLIGVPTLKALQCGYDFIRAEYARRKLGIETWAEVEANSK